MYIVVANFAIQVNTLLCFECVVVAVQKTFATNSVATIKLIAVSPVKKRGLPFKSQIVPKIPRRLM